METLLSQNCLFCNKKHDNWDELITCYKSNDLDKVKWDYISCNQKLSLPFIREFQDKVDWNGISYEQKLSLTFIKEFQDKIDWSGISYKQKLSLEFIKEFQDKINWNHISWNKYLTNDIILEFYNNLDKRVLLDRVNNKELKVSQEIRNRLILDRF